MTTFETLKTLTENDGFTLKANKPIKHSMGFQVATYGVEAKTPEEAEKAIDDFNGNAGVWYSGGIYYVDHSIYVRTKKQAVRIGKACHQQSILCWDDMSLMWLKRKENLQ